MAPTTVELKFEDLVKIKAKTLDDLKTSMDKLEDFTQQYLKTDDVFTLEGIKRAFVAELQFFTRNYANIKAFKGPNHTYFENQRKKVKADALELLFADGVKVTAAESKVYGTAFYVERIALLEKFTPVFIAVELKYEQYNNTLQAIVQSISVANKDLGNSKMTNS